jgi:hypothetical protein
MEVEEEAADYLRRRRYRRHRRHTPSKKVTTVNRLRSDHDCDDRNGQYNVPNS